MLANVGSATNVAYAFREAIAVAGGERPIGTW